MFAPGAELWALVTDAALTDDDGTALVGLGSTAPCAILVPPRYFEHTRSIVGDVIRSTTHPGELKTLGVTLCVVRSGSEVMSRHGTHLATFCRIITTGEDQPVRLSA
jgi:hypothetical protein